MTLREYAATYGNRMFTLRPPDGTARIAVIGSDPQRGLLTGQGWESFAAVTERALAQGYQYITHFIDNDGTLGKELITLEREAT